MMRVLAVCLAMRAAADMAVVPPAAPQQSSVRDWWFVSPVMEAVTLSEEANGTLVLANGVLQFLFDVESGDVKLSTVELSRSPHSGVAFTFPGIYQPDCNQMNCSALPGGHPPKPAQYAAMATVRLDGATYSMGTPSKPMGAAHRFQYQGHYFTPHTRERFHYVPGRRGGEQRPWPPTGGALGLTFSLDCSSLPTARAGQLTAVLEYELYAGVPMYVKRFNLTNDCDHAVFVSDKLFEQPGTHRADGYSQYKTFAHAPAYAFAPGETYEAPYTLGDFAAATTPEIRALQSCECLRIPRRVGRGEKNGGWSGAR
jgi:hypothetical protein